MEDNLSYGLWQCLKNILAMERSLVRANPPDMMTFSFYGFHRTSKAPNWYYLYQRTCKRSKAWFALTRFAHPNIIDIVCAAIWSRPWIWVIITTFDPISSVSAADISSVRQSSNWILNLFQWSHEVAFKNTLLIVDRIRVWTESSGCLINRCPASSQHTPMTILKYLSKSYFPPQTSNNRSDLVWFEKQRIVDNVKARIIIGGAGRC